MNGGYFSLKPFRSTGLPRQLSVTGNINLTSGMLAISYTLNGPLTKLVIPGPGDIPTRREISGKEPVLSSSLLCGTRKDIGNSISHQLDTGTSTGSTHTGKACMQKLLLSLSRSSFRDALTLSISHWSSI